MIVGSSVAGIGSTVIAVALPPIGRKVTRVSGLGNQSTFIAAKLPGLGLTAQASGLPPHSPDA
jgi:hypothetical protein